MSLTPADWVLLHREMDGETTRSESAALRERLSREPQLEAARRALLGLGRTLWQAHLVEPPPDLAREVMREVKARPRPTAGPAGLAGLKGWVVRRPALAVAACLAVGLLAGLLATGLSGPGGLAPIAEETVSGTLLPSGHGLPVVDEARLEGPGIEATARLRRGRDAVVAELEIASEGLDVTVEVDETALRPRGVECLGGEPAGGVVVEAGRVQVRQAPPGRCFVSLTVLEAGPGPLTVEVRAGERGTAVVLDGGPPR